jgi:hypothetical protein
MSLLSTFTNASINGWRNVSSSNYYLNSNLINNAPLVISFGYTTAMSDSCEYIIVGSRPADNAYIFKNNYDGSYTQQANFSYSDNISSVSINSTGEYAVVSRSQTFSSIINVYYRTGSTWSLQQTFTVIFGGSAEISGDGNYIIVGGSTTGNRPQASIYIRSGTSWTLQTAIAPGGTAGGSESVTINYDGTYMAFASQDQNSQLGKVWMYTRSGTSWSQQATFDLNNYSSQININSSCTSLSMNYAGTYVVVNAPYAPPTNYAGQAFIFKRTSTSWAYNASLTGVGAADENFAAGVRVCKSEDIFIASATYADTNGYTNNGAIYVFQKPVNDPVLLQILFGPPENNVITFTGPNGLSIDNTGNWILGGATNSNIYGTSNGIVLIYTST